MIDDKKETNKKSLSASEKADWNSLLDFMNSKGYRGSKELDKGDDSLAKSIVQQYRQLNPKTSITYDKVRPMQEAVLQDWDTMHKIQQLQGLKPTVRQLSPVDGRLGSLTSNAYFPTAQTMDGKGNVAKDWGHNIDDYYNYIADTQQQKLINNTPTIPIEPNKFKAMSGQVASNGQANY